jgi:TolB-like protein/class 3 adenylate cyclase
MQRTLAAILIADIAGYTRLMDSYEDETHQRLMRLIEEVVEPTIAARSGQIVKNTGDGFFAHFASVANATDCAIAIQRQVHEREVAHSVEMRIAFRMGLHVGDILIEERDVYGAGVNLAARLQEIGEPGCVTISASVREQLGANLKLPAVDLGPMVLKNIAEPVQVYCIVIPPGTDAPAAPAAGRHQHSQPSIAVLPFVEYGASDSFLGDGITEDIVAALASLPDIFVISRNSTLKYRENPPSIGNIGSELGVRYIFSGTVRRFHDRLRVSAELADTENLGVVAAERVEGKADELFTLQDRLAERVVQTIAPHIHDAELRRMRRKRTESLDAYDYLLRGLDLLYRLERREFEQALRMFELSIALDDSYAAPNAFTALWYSIRLNQGWSSDRAGDMAKVNQFAAAALLRDSNDVWGLALSGHLRALLFRDFDAAFDLFERALRACPNSAFAWARSSPAFSYVGQPGEGRHRAEQALRLSPFDPQLFFVHSALTLAAYTEGDYDTAIAWGRRSYAGNPRWTGNLRLLVASLAAGGRVDEARRFGETLSQLEPRFRVRAFCDNYAYAEEHRRQRLAEHLLLAGLPE